MNEWVGIPYARLDCLGLLCAWLRAQGYAVPVFDLSPGSLLAAMDFAQARLRRVDSIEEAVIVGLGQSNAVTHVGAVTPDGILHTLPKAGSCIQPLTALLRLPQWRQHRFYAWAR